MGVLSFGETIHLSVSSYYVCYLVSGLPDSVWYFLVPSICLQILWCHCFSVSIFHWRTSGCFWLLAIINKSSMCPCYMLEHLLGICPGVVWLGLQVELFPVFWGTAILFSKVVVPACNPTTSGQVFLFLPILDRICCQLINFSSSLYILDIIPLLDVWFVKIFSQSVGYHFVLLSVYFALQKLFNFILWFVHIYLSLCVWRE